MASREPAKSLCRVNSLSLSFLICQVCVGQVDRSGPSPPVFRMLPNVYEGSPSFSSARDRQGKSLAGAVP